MLFNRLCGEITPGLLRTGGGETVDRLIIYLNHSGGGGAGIFVF